MRQDLGHIPSLLQAADKQKSTVRQHQYHISKPLSAATISEGMQPPLLFHPPSDSVTRLRSFCHVIRDSLKEEQ